VFLLEWRAGEVSSKTESPVPSITLDSLLGLSSRLKKHQAEKHVTWHQEGPGPDPDRARTGPGNTRARTGKTYNGAWNKDTG